jgi:CHAT domain-containing protein/predicted negative regulator of RcsB-dependent stress response
VKILPSQAPPSFPVPGRALGALLGLLALVLLGCPLHPPRAVGPVAPAAPPVAEAPGPALSLEAAVERRLAMGGRDEIALDLAAGRYARVSFETPGVDVAVSLLGPRGEAIAATVGSDLRLSLVTATAGRYRIAVATPDSQDAVPYRLQLQESRPARPGDGARVAAENALLQAKLLESEKRFPQAIAQAQDALSRWSTVPDPPSGRFDALYELGVLHDLSRDQAPAVSYYRQALLAASEAGDPYGEAKARTALGFALFDSDPEAACADLAAALPVWRQRQDASNQAQVLYRLAVDQDRNRGQIEEAMSLYQQALPLADAIGNRNLEADIRNGLGNVYAIRGESQQALDVYEQALQLATDEEDGRRAKAVALTGLGKILRRRGEPQDALIYYQEALAINREIASGDPRQQTAVAIVLIHLGSVDLDLGQPDDALTRYREALAVLRANPSDPRWIVNALLSIGEVDLALGQNREALDRFEEALVVKGEERKAAVLHEIGVAQLKLRDVPAARKSLEAALALRHGRDRVGEALTYQQLGKVYQEEGDLKGAVSSLQQALTIVEEVGAANFQPPILFELARIERRRGRLHEALAEIGKAIAVLETVRSDLSEDRLRMSFFASRRSYYDFYVDLLMELDRLEPGQGYADEALAASEEARARSLLDLLTAAHMKLTRGISPDLRRREAETSARLLQIQGQLVEERSEKARASVLETLRLRREEAEKERDEVEQRIKADYPRYYQVRHPSLLNRASIQEMLDPSSALLEFSLGEEKCYLFVVTRERGLKVYPLDLSQQEIAAEVDKVRKVLGTADDLSYAYRSAAYRLYRSLVEPAREELKGKDRLLIAPDGALYQLPFDALLTARGQADTSLPYLAKRFSTSYIPSASVLSSLSSLRTASAAGGEPHTRFLAFAPSYGSVPGPRATRGGPESIATAGHGPQLASLEGAVTEVKAIAGQYPSGSVKLYLDAEASVENAKGNALIADSVHFAGHGLLDETHPESSGLVLARGEVLRVADIFNLDLSAGLVVLSACETAGREVTGEGLVGLTRAFLYAGSPSVVVTLWRVSDRATPDLMLRFYNGLNQNPEGDKAEALHQAKLAMIHEGGRLAHPYYWAPFILVGKAR